jgi:hypothetical protein
MQRLQGFTCLGKYVTAQAYIAESGVNMDTQHLTDVAAYPQPSYCAQYNGKISSVGKRKNCKEAR